MGFMWLSNLKQYLIYQNRGYENLMDFSPLGIGGMEKNLTGTHSIQMAEGSLDEHENESASFDFRVRRA
jgi:hypothetical protein